uniref:Glycosyltransferase n=1 Tax=Chenopodium quinoa TaxID=63459 RepID=A0A803N2D3_CHEQI
METIVLYPAPFVGHLISMIELGKLLLTHSPSISSITIIIPDSPICRSSTYSSYVSFISSSFPSITFVFHPPVPLLLGDLSKYDDVEQITYETLRSNNTNVLKSLESIAQSSTISAFILDFFCYSAVEVSQSLNIPTYFFFASGAFVLAFFLNLPIYDRTYTDSYRNLRVSLEIPGLFSFPTSSMIECMLDRGESYKEFVKLGETFLKSDGIIVNTFESLEIRAVKGLKQGTCLPGAKIPHVYCVGPLIAKNRGGEGGGESRHECLSWLDSQPSRSVVYLCFGSGDKAKVLSRSLVEPDLDSFLPEGFLERTKDRGHVVKMWVPQIDVLGHGSVGGFVTHCGWNSTLEAVCAGVPMVAWPLYAEQRFNKILIVEEIGIALPMDETEDRFVSSSEIERRVKQIISSEEGDVVRERVLDLKSKAEVVFSEGGSSEEALNLLVKSWKDGHGL